MNTTRNSYAGFDRLFDQTYNAVLNYQKAFGDHYVTALGGIEYYDTYMYGFPHQDRALLPATSAI